MLWLLKHRKNDWFIFYVIATEKNEKSKDHGFQIKADGFTNNLTKFF